MLLFVCLFVFNMARIWCHVIVYIQLVSLLKNEQPTCYKSTDTKLDTAPHRFRQRTCCCFYWVFFKQKMWLSVVWLYLVVHCVYQRKCFHKTHVDTNDQKGISQQLRSIHFDGTAHFHVVVCFALLSELFLHSQTFIPWGPQLLNPTLAHWLNCVFIALQRHWKVGKGK